MKDKEHYEELVTKGGLRQVGALNHIFFIMITDDVAKENKSKIMQTDVGYKRLETVTIDTI